MALAFYLIFSALLRNVIATGANPGNVKAEEPIFVEEIQNVTVTAGRDVKLACVVERVGTYKIAWIAFDKSAILTVQEHVITRNPRINVTYDGYRTWTLHIEKVNASDAGMYMCQINTKVAKSQFGYINVVVPPNIIDTESSGDIVINEDSTVLLKCRATGTPTPNITWRREDTEKINLNRTYSVKEFAGTKLRLNRISRTDMAAYLCIATNGVLPIVSKRVKVSVDFPPMMTIPHQLVGAPLGYSITLECTIEAHPSPLTYWTKNKGENNMLHTSNKYLIKENAGDVSYRTHMKLTIHRLVDDDFDSYKCVAKNSRGETEGNMKLYKSDPPTTLATTPPSYLDSFFNKGTERGEKRHKSEKQQGIPKSGQPYKPIESLDTSIGMFGTTRHEERIEEETGVKIEGDGDGRRMNQNGDFVHNFYSGAQSEHTVPSALMSHIALALSVILINL